MPALGSKVNARDNLHLLDPLVDPLIAVYNFWCIKRGAERPANLPQLRQGGFPIREMRLIEQLRE